MNQLATVGLENLAFNSTSTYRVFKELARGGMGIIFVAQKDTGGVLDEVVVKTLRVINVEEEEKLKQEANIATMLRHENIVKTYGLEMVRMSRLPDEFCKLIQQESSAEDEKKLSLFARIAGLKTRKLSEKMMMMMVMDYVKGTDLYTLMMRHLKNNLLLPVPLAAFMICRIACALAYAHTYIVHRDISPENILISEQGVCKLTDFGIAVVAHQQPDYWAGKLMYMAPEQIRNEKIDERADIFALGVVAYQILTGIPLLYALPNLEFEEQVRIIYKQMETDLVPPHLVRTDIPLELSRIIFKMLALAPEYRYQRAASVVNDLEKEYLYAKGFGPTNNSLASYIDIFNSNFQEYNEDELQQLSFLKDEHGNLCLKRPLTVESFTRTGQRLLADRKGSAIVNQLRKIHKEQKERQPKAIQITKIPVVKVKYLDNVIECFALSDGQEITVGRNPKNVIVLPERIVSSFHARFYIYNEVPVIEDTNSNNGTLVNGERITRVKLQEGDKIQIGATLFYFLWEKRPNPSENIISLSSSTSSLNFADVKDIMAQFFPTEENLSKLNEITDAFLQQTPIGLRKRNVIIPAIYEAVRIFSGEMAEHSIQCCMLRGKKYVSFRCISPEKSQGYENFLAAVHRRSSSEASTKGSLEPQELAISLILKVFERIEIMRFSREVYMTNFF